MVVVVVVVVVVKCIVGAVGSCTPAFGSTHLHYKRQLCPIRSASILGSKRDMTWTINLCTPPMRIHKITPSLDYNWWLKRWVTQINELTNQN